MYEAIELVSDVGSAMRFNYLISNAAISCGSVSRPVDCRTNIANSPNPDKRVFYHVLLGFTRYDHPDILAGQGTCGLEIVDQVDNIDAVVIPVGGAGLIAGCAVAIKTLHPEIQVIVSFFYSRQMSNLRFIKLAGTSCFF